MNATTDGKPCARAYLVNAFSLNMFGVVQAGTHQLMFWPLGSDFSQAAENIDEWQKRGFELVNAIGHQETDEIVRSQIPGLPKGERVSVELRSFDRLIVAQYTGPRLPEGATKLPEGARINYWLVWPLHNSEASMPEDDCTLGRNMRERGERYKRASKGDTQCTDVT
jgi:hypothetical protein